MLGTVKVGMITLCIIASAFLTGCPGATVPGKEVKLLPSEVLNLEGKWNGRFTAVGAITGTTYADRNVIYILSRDGKGEIEIPCCSEIIWRVSDGKLFFNVDKKGERQATVTRDINGDLHMFATWDAKSFSGRYPQKHSVRLRKNTN